MGTPDGSGGGSAVELDIEGLRQVGKNTSELAAEALAAQQTVESTKGEASMYGQYPAAQALAQHHDSVATVFATTLGALQQEMDEFGLALTTAADNYADTDDGVQGAMASIATRFAGSASSTTDSFNNALADQGTDLLDPDQVEVDVDTLTDSDSEILRDVATELGGGTEADVETSTSTSGEPDATGL
jgi:hypothetical protein